MNKTIPVEGYSCKFDLPDICPHCNIGMMPILSTYNANIEKSNIGIIIKCPSCKNIFFVLYDLYMDEYNNLSSSLSTIYPEQEVLEDLPSKIKDYFPEFHEIYNQAHIAENKNLNEITGMAYRKSLEFLVKNYLIQKLPHESDSVIKETLGASIKRIEFPSIKALAIAASWLGNDQTHFVKKHIDYDLKDMKAFIIALCHLIISERVADEALQLIKK